MFVIRSMTTTDFNPFSKKPVVPYHIYLREPLNRARAYWAHQGEAQRFATVEEAQAEIDRAFPVAKRDRFWQAPDIVPEKAEALGLLHYWQIRRLRHHFEAVDGAY